MSAMSRARRSDRLHDHNRLRGRQRHGNTGDLDPGRAAHDLLLQRQRAEDDIDSNSAWLVRDQQNRGLSVRSRGRRRLRGTKPNSRPAARNAGQSSCSSSTSTSMSSVSRGRPRIDRGDSTDDRAGNSAGIEPLGHRTERMDERRLRTQPPAGGSTLCQALPF